jgi:hypothetical protein
MAQVAFDYYSTALCSARRTRKHQGLLELPKLESSTTVPQCASYHRRSAIRNFNWLAKPRVANRSAQGGPAAKATHTYRMSRSTRNHARKYLCSPNFCRSKRLKQRWESTCGRCSNTLLGHATRVDPRTNVRVTDTRQRCRSATQGVAANTFVVCA